jgi:hypothetical protein
MSRTIDDATLDQAILEALRFAKAAQALRAARKARKHEARIMGNAWAQSAPKENAACFRASLDLTNKLAELRGGK